jgi:hypothetical protein
MRRIVVRNAWGTGTQAGVLLEAQFGFEVIEPDEVDARGGEDIGNPIFGHPDAGISGAEDVCAVALMALAEDGWIVIAHGGLDFDTELCVIGFGIVIF